MVKVGKTTVVEKRGRGTAGGSYITSTRCISYASIKPIRHKLDSTFLEKRSTFQNSRFNIFANLFQHLERTDSTFLKSRSTFFLNLSSTATVAVAAAAHGEASARRRAGDGVQPRRRERGAEGRRDGSRRRERGAEGRRDGGAAAHAASYGRRRRGGAAAGCSGTAAAAHAGRKEAAGKQC